MEKRIVKCLSVFISISVMLSICLITCSAYSNRYPAYLGFSDCAYIEVNSGLGKGSIVIPQNYQYDYLAEYGNTLANIGTNTISGYFIGQNGQEYSIRLQSLNVLQYSTQTGYQTIWNTLSINEILNTNCNIRDVESESSDKVFHFSTYEIIVISLILFGLFIEFFKLIYARSRYARVV